MAIRSFFTSFRGIIPPSLTHLCTETSWRPISSLTSAVDILDESSISPKKYDLQSRIFELKFSRRSATTVLQNWVDERYKVTVFDLRRISKQLVKSHRYKHALEILTWMEYQNQFQMSATDHAARLELIIKVHGLTEAEQYFNNINNTASQKAACLPLLHSYVKERLTEKAETFMLKLNQMGLSVTPHPFNEMMKLYMATSQFEYVPAVILQMKQNKIPRNVLSYNLWMGACGEITGVASAEMVYREMTNDENVEVGWGTLSTLGNVYLKAGLVDRANLALRSAEKKLSTCNHLGYFFIMTLYASLKNKKGVLRLWEASKAVGGRMTCANYMCILSCLVKLGDLAEAERIFMEWESKCLKYDIRVSNVLLGAYMRSGLMEKTEALHLHTLEKGGSPNYKTWEILMQGWVKRQNMDKAIHAMKKGFAMLKHCEWRPPHTIVMTIAEHFEKHGSFEEASRYFRVVQRLGLASLPLYKSLLRMHLSIGRPALDIIKMMEKDKIEMDDETSALVRAFDV